MASNTAETGLPNVAAMPAAAPAASSVLRSAGVVYVNCPNSEPRRAPVAMIGPSAPNGPPVPIEMAAETGFRKVNRAGNAAVVDEHLLHRLGDAVAADRLGTVAGHEADDQAADDRDENHPDAQARSGPEWLPRTTSGGRTRDS